MTLKTWVHDPMILGHDQPFFKGQKETPGNVGGATAVLGLRRPGPFGRLVVVGTTSMAHGALGNA